MKNNCYLHIFEYNKIKNVLCSENSIDIKKKLTQYISSDYWLSTNMKILIDYRKNNRVYNEEVKEYNLYTNKLKKNNLIEGSF